MFYESNYYIDYRMLDRMNACGMALEDFRSQFGSGRVFLTTDNVRRARDEGLSLAWLINRMEEKAERMGPDLDRYQRATVSEGRDHCYRFGGNESLHVRKIFNALLLLAQVINARRP